MAVGITLEGTSSKLTDAVTEPESSRTSETCDCWGSSDSETTVVGGHGGHPGSCEESTRNKPWEVSTDISGFASLGNELSTESSSI